MITGTSHNDAAVRNRHPFGYLDNWNRAGNRDIFIGEK